MYFDENYKPKKVEVDLNTKLINYSNSYKSSLDNFPSELIKEFKDEIKSPSNLNSLGYYNLFEGNVDLAIAIFKSNTSIFPNEANAYDSLGEA